MKQSDVLLKLARLAGINRTQKILLKTLAEGGRGKNATQFVNSCKFAPHSTIWHNLRLLRKKGILEFGNEQSVQLTELGTIIMENGIADEIEGEKEWLFPVNKMLPEISLQINGETT